MIAAKFLCSTELFKPVGKFSSGGATSVLDDNYFKGRRTHQESKKWRGGFSSKPLCRGVIALAGTNDRWRRAVLCVASGPCQ